MAAAPARTADGVYEDLTVVRRYLVDESSLAEAEKSSRRERAIEALTEIMGNARGADDGAAE